MNTTGMGRDAQIHIRVTEERKQEWKESVAASNEYKDLTHLVVTAVESELRSESKSQPTRSVNSVTVDLSEVHERMDDIREELSDVKDISLDTYELVREDDEIMQIATLILDKIPEVESEEEIRNRVSESEVIDERIAETGSSWLLEKNLQAEGYDVYTVNRALDKLIKEMETVHTVRVNDDSPDGKESEKRYYRLKE